MQQSERTAEREATADAAVPAELIPLLYAQLRRLAGPRHDLDDLVQAAAERAVRAWPRFERRSALSTWTYAIAYRAFLDHERWHHRFRRRFFGEDALSLEPASPLPDAEALNVQVTRARCLHRALNQLAPAKRAVVILHDLEGLPLPEVAAIVGVNERTVRSRLHDARVKLVDLLRRDPQFGAEEEP